MSAKLEDHFTFREYKSLAPEQQRALRRVAEYRAGMDLDESPSDEDLSEIFGILRPCEGCVPAEELGDEPLEDIRRKFACIYHGAVELVEEELRRKRLQSCHDFAFCVVIDPRYDDATRVAIVDHNYNERPFCYFHDSWKAWHFAFADLKAIADEVLKAKETILATFLRLTQQPAASTPRD
jgi:hypothetical protein